MSWREIHGALERRDPAALAGAMTPRNVHDVPQTWLGVALCEFSVLDLKHVYRWAEDWLSDRKNHALRVRGDSRWHAMDAVYLMARTALCAIGADTTET